MKIKLLSDLHLEFLKNYQTSYNAWANCANSDVLVLAGDIAVGVGNVESAIHYFLANHAKTILYLPGNHEYYYQEFDSFIPELRKRLSGFPVHILDCNEVVTIEDVSFFGGSLWTDFQDDSFAEASAKTGISDFRVIKDFSTTKAKEINRKHAQFIKYAYENTPGKKCIITHFLPANECVAERYKSDKYARLLNKYFANDLGSWIETLENTTWLYGHTHDVQEHLIGTTRLFSNPLGYPNDFSNGFDPNFHITI